MKGETVISVQKAQKHILFPTLLSSAMRYFIGNSITNIVPALAENDLSPVILILEFLVLVA